MSPERVGANDLPQSSLQKITEAVLLFLGSENLAAWGRQRQEQKRQRQITAYNSTLEPRIAVAAQFASHYGHLFCLLETGFAGDDPRVWQELSSDIGRLRRRYNLTDEELEQSAEIAVNPLFDPNRNWHELAAEQMTQDSMPEEEKAK